MNIEPVLVCVGESVVEAFMKVRGFIVLAAALVGVSGTVLAHHSQTMFDETKMVTLQGTISRFAWINPHVQIYFDVTENGKTQTWQIEANSALTMGRAGWKRDQFKAGDAVTVSFHPMRNGSAHGYLRKIVGPDGKPLEMAGNAPPGYKPQQ